MPQLTFLLASHLIPLGQDEFVMEGIDACYPDVNTSKIRSEYKKPKLLLKLKRTAFSIAFSVCYKIVVTFLSLVLSKYYIYIEPFLYSFLLGSQLASIYTMRIRQGGLRGHVIWCKENALRIIGFTLFLAILDKKYEWISAVVFLGLGHSASAALVQQLVMEDVGVRKDLHPVKIH